jgi:hypothetical protein
MNRRRRLKQSTPLKDRLAEWADEVRAQAQKLPPGAERDALLKKLRRADTASHLDGWVNSLGLRPPT